MTKVNYAEAKHMIVRKDGAAAWEEAEESSSQIKINWLA